MPLTKTGKKVLASMKKQYGKKRRKSVFYASINKGVKGSRRWHKLRGSGTLYGMDCLKKVGAVNGT